MALAFRKLGYLVLFIVFAAPAGLAQPKLIEFGIKAGVPLNDLVEGPSVSDDSLGFTAGGLLELNLPFGFAVEANALYKRPGYTNRNLQTEGITLLEEGRRSQWEFPILAKVYPLGRNPLIQPYAAAGVSFRRTERDPVRIQGHEITRGFVVSTGVRNGPGPIKIAPELRYTRWFGEATLLSAQSGSFAQTGANQVEFLVGITF